MVRLYAKGAGVSLSPHFNSVEFDCACKRGTCSTTLIDDELVQGLEVLRSNLGPIKVNSGFRCVPHNAEIGGKEKSQHLLGIAADVKCVKGYSGFAIAREAERISCFFHGGIGMGSDWSHLDVRQNGPARWTYTIK